MGIGYDRTGHLAKLAKALRTMPDKLLASSRADCPHGVVRGVRSPVERLAECGVMPAQISPCRTRMAWDVQERDGRESPERNHVLAVSETVALAQSFVPVGCTSSEVHRRLNFEGLRLRCCSRDRVVEKAIRVIRLRGIRPRRCTGIVSCRMRHGAVTEMQAPWLLGLLRQSQLEMKAWCPWPAPN
jgi:hypothetical protein